MIEPKFYTIALKRGEPGTCLEHRLCVIHHKGNNVNTLVATCPLEGGMPVHNATWFELPESVRIKVARRCMVGAPGLFNLSDAVTK